MTTDLLADLTARLDRAEASPWPTVSSALMRPLIAWSRALIARHALPGFPNATFCATCGDPRPCFDVRACADFWAKVLP